MKKHALFFFLGLSAVFLLAASGVRFIGYPGVSSDGSSGIAVEGDVTSGGNISGADGTFTGDVTIGSPNRNALIAALESGDNVGVQVIGDSTGNQTTEWVYLLGAALGSDYPDHAIQYRLFNATTQDYDAAVTIQAGTNGLEKYTLDGIGGIYVTDAIIADFASDPDIRLKFTPAAWPVATAQNLFVHYDSATNNRSLWIYARTDGKLSYIYNPDGQNGNDVTVASTAAATISTSTPSWIRLVHDIDNGSGGNDVKFYTSSDGNTWTQLGSTVTGAGAATIYAANANWEMGIRGSTSQPLSAVIYEVEVRDGVDAWPPNNAFEMSDWIYATHSTRSGGPTLNIYNASVASADIAYQVDAGRLAKTCVDYGQIMTIVGISHNEDASTGSTFVTAYGALIDDIKTALPLSDIVILTENPEKSPATYELAHDRRRLELISFAHRNGYGSIDLFNGFTDSYIDADGVHPTAAGSALWASIVDGWLKTESPR